MAKQFQKLDASHRAFIAQQHIFFVASAAADTRVNLSPKGSDCLRVLSDNRVAYLDLTGSGMETSAHLLADGRLTMMFCAFEGAPMILRLYGIGRSHFAGTPDFDDLLAELNMPAPPGARQIVTLDFDLVHKSCGFAVPNFSYEEDRDTLHRWATAKGEQGLNDYRAEKSRLSLDSLPTGLPLQTPAEAI